MLNPVWSKAIKASADPQRAKHFLALFSDTSARAALEKATAEEALILTAIFGGSEALSNILIAHPEWLQFLGPEGLKFPRRKQGMLAEVQEAIQTFIKNRSYDEVLKCVRQFKLREMLRIGARDLARLAGVVEITRELSDVADVSLQWMWIVCIERLTEKHGTPHHQDADGKWRNTKGCVLGMGKLGGQELNYSSDVDVLFVYEDEGKVQLPASGNAGFRAAPSGLSNHAFFCRAAEMFIAEVSRMTPEGMLYRIDLRLRPEGNLGPLARSLASYENYYSQWGQTWERMMMIKARCVAGDQGLAAEFLEMIQSFRYPRSISHEALQEVAAVKARIENEVLGAGELERNVKLGRGGIREIEFVAQSKQLLHAGRQPFLQGSQTLPCLEKLAQYQLLEADETRKLKEAYCFLRDVEHRLQMEGNLQTHLIPQDQKAQGRLARLMGFATLKQFETVHKAHRKDVREIFERVLKGKVEKTDERSPFPETFEGAESGWKTLLKEHGFRDVDKAFRVLREFVEGPGYVHVSSRTRELAMKLVPTILRSCHGANVTAQKPGKGESPRRLSDPDRVVTRLDSFITAYGARSTLFELWTSNPAIFELLVVLFDRSEFLAELAIRTPDLVDELVISGRLRQRKTRVETLEDLRHGIKDADQSAWMRKYHQVELMRIGLRDILGLADEEQYLVELSALADACLQYALEVVMKRYKLKEPPFAIIGLGKLGGAEIDYGSDLDILFVTETSDSKRKLADKNKKAEVAKSRKTSAGAESNAMLVKMAAEVMDLLSARTELGLLFHTDARLRPDGEKGLLVNTLTAYEEYYRQRAALWEIQSLTRTRAVAGDVKVGAAFQKLAGTLANFKNPSQPLVAYTPKWKAEIHRMRIRIEKERTPAGKDTLAIKTGRGGLMDAEFVAQALCLENGWHQANTLESLKTEVRSLEPSTAGKDAVGKEPPAKLAKKVSPPALSSSKKSVKDKPQKMDRLIENYRRLRKLEGILRRWSYEGETVLPDDPAAFYRVAVRCGFETSEDFREAVANWRKEIRNGYEEIFGVGNQTS